MSSRRFIALALVSTALSGAALGMHAPTPAESLQAAASADPKAKELLTRSSEAMKKVGGLTFSSKRGLTGDVPLKLSAAGTVQFLRNQGTPSASTFYAKGTMSQILGDGIIPIEGYFNGTTAVWIDEKKLEVVEKAVAASDAAPRLKTNIKQQFIPAQYFDSEPFMSELNAPTIAFAEPEVVAGVECDVVRLVGSNNRETRLSIARSDLLLRKVAQISPAPGGKGMVTLTVELSDLKPATVAPGSFKIDLPAGYTKRVEEAPRPVPPVNVDPNKAMQPTPPQVQPKGGLEAGAAAPGWVLKPADGTSNVTLADQKGKVVVLGFWGSVFGDSRQMLSTLEEASKAYAGGGVSVFGVACREQPGAVGADAAKRAFADAKCSFPLLLEGDASATDYKLRGFPSVAVIDGTGKIAAFFESSPGLEALKAAIDQAKSAK
ncbi:MAG: TlpA family protein disulfide reductase [Phycisphaerales bacterium]